MSISIAPLLTVLSGTVAPSELIATVSPSKCPNPVIFLIAIAHSLGSNVALEKVSIMLTVTF